jgi:hypothetical protein
MATYVYETLSRPDGAPARRFEVVQSMKDAPLTRHPDTGEPIRRVISGGYGLIQKAGPKSPPATAAAACAPGCACHAGPRLPVA